MIVLIKRFVLQPYIPIIIYFLNVSVLFLVVSIHSFFSSIKLFSFTLKNYHNVILSQKLNVYDKKQNVCFSIAFLAIIQFIFLPFTPPKKKSCKSLL